MSVEEKSESELPIRNGLTVPEGQLPFTEEKRPRLADRDRDFVLALLANPLDAVANLKKAAEEYRRRHS